MEKPFEKTIEIFFPFKGLSQIGSYAIESIPPTGSVGNKENQTPVLTSPYLLNVRVRGPEEERARGGQRPGLKKAFTTQIGGAYPIINMTQVVTTYITPA
jgi:hypothetical protein